MALSPAAKVVYRGLLRWCKQETVRKTPFRLPVLSKDLLHVWSDKPVYNWDGTARFIKESFQAAETEDLDTGFLALRELDKFTSYLEGMQLQREMHLDREDVVFNVGQVVRHRQSGCRCVVYGWDHAADVSVDIDEDSSSSGRGREQPFYYLLPDGDDSMFAFGETRDTMYIAEDELEQVFKLERRIDSNLLQSAFECFDSLTESFVPDAMLQYTYPDTFYEMQQAVVDPSSGPAMALLDENLNQARNDIVEQLEKLDLQLDKLMGERLWSAFEAGWSQEQTMGKLRIMHRMYVLASQVLSRRRAVLSTDPVEFELGQVLQHQQWDYRGVVYGWDSKPTLDVSEWEGVVQLESGADQPFYYILPDHSDCVAAFGSARQSRYVAQENLVPVDKDSQRLISAPGLEMMFDHFDPVQQRWKPSQQLRIGYLTGDQCSSEDTEAVAALELISSRVEEASADHRVLDAVFTLLGDANQKENAQLLEDAAWLCWATPPTYPDTQIKRKTEEGSALMERGAYQLAIDTFSGVIEQAPGWAEAWNKRAIAHYLAGDNDQSLSDIRQALQLEPRHFGALCGRAKVNEKQEDWQNAIDSYREALGLQPWLATVGSSIHFARLEMLHQELRAAADSIPKASTSDKVTADSIIS